MIGWVEVVVDAGDLDGLVSLGAVEVEGDGASVIGLFAESAGLERAVREAFGARAVVRPAEMLDWGSVWARALRPVRVGGRVLAIGAEGVFGSGGHETTSMCLERIAEVSPIGRFLDVGTGTGVLALAALGLGASVVVGTDVVGLEVARANALRNGFEGRLTLSEEPPDRLGLFDVVAANLLGALLVELAPLLVRALGTGGLLITSGIRASEREEVSKAFLSLGLRPAGEESRGGWWRLDFLAGW